MADDRKARMAQHDYWNELFEIRDRQRADLKNAIQVVERDALPVENNRQGLMRWYTHPNIRDTVLRTQIFFEQEIPPGSRSGRLKFGGGQILYILEGKGYTLIDGVKHHWEADDVVNLPLRKDGIVVQHVNESADQPVRFVACEQNWTDCVGVDRGCGFEQIEDSPDYRKK